MSEQSPAEPPSKPKAPPRARRRKRRGHSAEAPPSPAVGQAPPRSRAVKSTRQLDSEAFARVDAMLGSFARRRYGELMQRAAKGFFGEARGDEAKAPEIQTAFMLDLVYGYRDARGQRIVDVFARYGLELDREQRRVLDALLRARYVVFGLEGKNAANKQIQGRDLLRGVPMVLLDHNIYAQLEVGAVLAAFMFPVGDLWRAVGVGTTVPRAKAKLLQQGMSQLASSQGFALAELAERRASQLFWLAYRVAEMTVPLAP